MGLLPFSHIFVDMQQPLTQFPQLWLCLGHSVYTQEGHFSNDNEMSSLFSKLWGFGQPCVLSCFCIWGWLVQVKWEELFHYFIISFIISSCLHFLHHSFIISPSWCWELRYWVKENLFLLFTDEQHMHILCLSIFRLFIKISDKTKRLASLV